MNLTDWVSLVLVCSLGAASPGPSFAVIISVTERCGRSSGLAAAIGHGLGVFIYALIAAASLSIVLTHYKNLFYWLQLVGALVLVWIGVKLVLITFSAVPKANAVRSDSAMSRSFWNGFVIAISNPKIAAFFASLFSQFIESGQSKPVHLAMASVAGIIDVIVYAVLVLIATTNLVGAILAKYSYVNDLILGVVLCILGCVLFVHNINQIVL